MKPFLKPIIHSPSALTNRVLIRNGSYLSNNSDISKNNNSLSTVASAARKNYKFLPKLKTPRSSQILKNVNFDFFKKRNNIGNNYYVTPSAHSILLPKAQRELISDADHILRERMSNQNNILSTGRRHIRSVAIGLSKGISQKNYTINLLKEQRTKINEKERMIEQAVKEFSEQYEKDYKSFFEFVTDEKRKQQLEESTMNYLKEKKEKKKESLEEETLMNKRLEEALEKRIREIYQLKSYGSFLHQVFDKKFSFDELITSDSRGKNFEKIARDLIALYENKNKYETIPKELNNTDNLIKTYILFEDRILMALKSKDLSAKEIANQKQIYQKELEQIKLSLIDYESDFKYLKEERNIVKGEMRNFKISQNETMETILTCIIDLGKDIGTDFPIPISMDKNHLIEYTMYAKKTLENLRGTEVLVNDLITEIESTLEFGDKEDKNLMIKCIGEQKKINKKEKQLKLKLIQEEIKNQKNMRALKRANKVVVAGRKAPMIFNMKNKHKNKFTKIKFGEKVNEKVSIYNISDDDDYESEDK